MKFWSLPQLPKIGTCSNCIRKGASAKCFNSFHLPLTRSQAFRRPIRTHHLFPCNHSLLFCNSIVLLLTNMLHTCFFHTHTPQSNFLQACLRKARLDPLILCYILVNWGASIPAQLWRGAVHYPGSQQLCAPPYGGWVPQSHPAMGTTAHCKTPHHYHALKHQAS